MNQPLSRPAATLSPPCGEREGRGVPIWFMVPMHAKKRKRASHESSSCSGVSAERRRLLFPRIAALYRDAATPGFMVPNALRILGLEATRE